MFKDHLDNISKKVSGRSSLLSRIQPYITKRTALLVYNATVFPILDYCSITWETFFSQENDNLQSLQKRASKIIVNANVNFLTPMGNSNWVLLVCWHPYKVILVLSV